MSGLPYRFGEPVLDAILERTLRDRGSERVPERDREYVLRRLTEVMEDRNALRPPPPELAPPPTLCFLDTETTGLHPELHEVWEVGLIERRWSEVNNAYEETEYLWQLPVDLGRADPVSLRIGGFHDRRWPMWEGPEEPPEFFDTRAHKWRAIRSGRSHTEGIREQCPLPAFASRFAELTRGAHLIGNVVSFDERRLDALLRANGALPEWHYHLIDVEALAVGYIRGRIKASDLDGMPRDAALGVVPPWKSDDLMKLLGIEGPSDEDRHTALGDARWARDVYDKVMG